MIERTYAPCIGGLPGVLLDGGMWELASKLEVIPGVMSEVFPWFMWKKARNKAIRLFREGKLDFFTPCGHSFGCYEIIKMAEDVKKAGIMVRYVGAIDPTAGFVQDVPSNVEYVSEHWAAYGVPAAARRGDPDGERGGRYRYPNDTPHKVYHYPGGHIALGSNDTVHARIVAGITGAIA